MREVLLAVFGLCNQANCFFVARERVQEGLQASQRVATVVLVNEKVTTRNSKTNFGPWQLWDRFFSYSLFCCKAVAPDVLGLSSWDDVSGCSCNVGRAWKSEMRFPILVLLRCLEQNMVWKMHLLSKIHASCLRFAFSMSSLYKQQERNNHQRIQPATTKTPPPDGTAEGWFAPRFGHRAVWSHRAHAIGKFFLRLNYSLFLFWNFRPRLPRLYLNQLAIFVRPGQLGCTGRAPEPHAAVYCIQRPRALSTALCKCAHSGLAQPVYLPCGGFRGQPYCFFSWKMIVAVFLSERRYDAIHSCTSISISISFLSISISKSVSFPIHIHVHIHIHVRI